MRSRQRLLHMMGALLVVAAARANTTPSVNCTPFPQTFANGNGGPSAVSCPPFTVLGGNLHSATLSYSADYQFGSTTGTNSVQVTFVPAGPGGVTWSPGSVTLTTTGGQSSGSIQTGSATTTGGVSASAFASAFNVNISSAVTQGTVATSSGAVSIVYTYDPPPLLTLACSATGSLPAGTVGTPYSGMLSATGGVPPYTFSVPPGTLPPGLTLNSSTGAITGTPTTSGTFTFAVLVTDSTGASATSSCSIVISPTPPPPTTGCNNSAATLVFPTGGVPENAFLIRYAANLNLGDSVVDITNYGLNGAPLQGPGFGSSAGNICVNVYTFAPDEQLASCCSCLVTPNAVVSLSVNRDLLGMTLTPAVPNSVVIKLVASTPGANTLTGGMAAWGTSLHQLTATGGTAVGETPFTPATLSAGELASITGRCASNIANGSGFGICAACRIGALGAGKQ